MTSRSKDIKTTKGSILVRFSNSHALQDSITFDSGDKIFVHGDERPEVWANTIGECVASGVDGVSVGNTVGCSYQAVFDYDHDNFGNKIWNNCYMDDSGAMIFKVSADMVMWIRGQRRDVAFGNWVLMKPVMYGEGDMGVGEKRGIAEHVSGMDGVDAGVPLAFNPIFRGTELYDRKYIVLTKDRILAYGHG